MLNKPSKLHVAVKLTFAEVELFADSTSLSATMWAAQAELTRSCAS